MFQFLIRLTAIVLWPIYFYMPAMREIDRLAWMQDEEESNGAMLLSFITPFVTLCHVFVLKSVYEGDSINWLYASMTLHLFIGLCVFFHPMQAKYRRRSFG